MHRGERDLELGAHEEHRDIVGAEARREHLRVTEELESGATRPRLGDRRGHDRGELALRGRCDRRLEVADLCCARARIGLARRCAIAPSVADDGQRRQLHTHHRGGANERLTISIDDDSLAPFIRHLVERGCDDFRPDSGRVPEGDADLGDPVHPQRLSPLASAAGSSNIGSMGRAWPWVVLSLGVAIGGCAGAEAMTLPVAPKDAKATVTATNEVGLNPGETMTFEVKLGGVLAGEAALAVGEVGGFEGKRAVVVRSRANTAGAAALFKRIVDEATTVIDMENGRPLKLETNVEQGDKKTTATATFVGNIADVTYTRSGDPDPHKY